MAYCENCGSRLCKSNFFCENCGKKLVWAKENIADREHIEWDNEKNIFSLFQSPEWEYKWKEVTDNAGECELGIIITKEKSLLNCLVGSSEEALHLVVSEYARFRKNHGVEYYYLDLDNNTVSSDCNDVYSIVNTLRKIADIAPWKYLFILGNEKIIDVALWEDRTEDDNDIESDWCYATLDVTSPWKRDSYVWEKTLRVGRLPIYCSESFEDFKSYFETVMLSSDTNKLFKTYGLSAFAWEKESEYEYKTFSNVQLDTSPEVTLTDVKTRFSPNTDIFFFNLHGSNETEYWYGEDLLSYPEVISPTVFDNNMKPYIIAVEACYGARYTGNLTARDSTLLNAMTHKCISFVGSSRIAYGQSSPPGSCADIIVGEFLRQIITGKTAGDAFIQSMQTLVSACEILDDAELKTLVEFSLYGDPAVSIKCSEKKPLGRHNHKSVLSKFFHRVEVPMPDIRTPVRMGLAKIDKQIEQMIDDFVFRTYFNDIDFISVADIQQKVFRLSDLSLNQKVFRRQLVNFSKIVKVYFDDAGKIKKVYESK